MRIMNLNWEIYSSPTFPTNVLVCDNKLSDVGYENHDYGIVATRNKSADKVDYDQEYQNRSRWWTIPYHKKVVISVVPFTNMV